MLSYANQITAAGTFRASAPVPVVHDATHPCLLWHTRGLSWQRSFLTSPSCVGIGYLDQSFAVRILSAPYIHAPEPSFASLIVGSDGDSALTARPLSLTLEGVLSKVLTLVPRRETADDPLADHLPSDMLGPCYTAPTWPDANVPAAELGHDRFSTALIPVAFPLIPGHPVLEGPITSPTVVTALVDYHPLLEYLVSAAETLRSNPRLSMAVTDFIAEVLPAGTDPSDNVLLEDTVARQPVILYQDEAAGMYDPFSVVSARVAAVRDANTAVYLAAHPQPSAQPPSVPPVQQIDQHSISLISEATAPGSKLLENRRPYFLLFAATVGKDAVSLRPTVVLPDLSEDFRSVFTIASAVDRDSLYRSHLAALQATRQESPLALESMVEIPHLSAVACRALLRMSWKETSLDEDASSLGQVLSVYTYLAPPRDIRSAHGRAYQAAKDATNLAVTEARLEEAGAKRTKMATSAFLLGRQSSPNDLATAISNILADFAFRFDLPADPEHGPTILHMLRGFASAITKKSFLRWYDRHFEKFPWITHVLLSQIHTLLASAAKIASSPANIRLVRADLDIPPETYAPLTAAYTAIMRDIEQAVLQSAPGVFAHAPTSYAHAPSQPKRRRGQDSNDDRRPPPRDQPERSDPTKGFISQYYDRVIVFPDSLSQRYCQAFCQTGFSCANPRNTCSHGRHVTSWSFVPDADKRIFSDFAHRNRALVRLNTRSATPSRARTRDMVRPRR